MRHWIMYGLLTLNLGLTFMVTSDAAYARSRLNEELNTISKMLQNNACLSFKRLCNLERLHQDDLCNDDEDLLGYVCRMLKESGEEI